MERAISSHRDPSPISSMLAAFAWPLCNDSWIFRCDLPYSVSNFCTWRETEPMRSHALAFGGATSWGDFRGVRRPSRYVRGSGSPSL